jgi:hypothetical protein
VACIRARFVTTGIWIPRSVVSISSRARHGIEPGQLTIHPDRGRVCWRRSTGGSRSECGDLLAANLKSVIHTCRKQHRDVLTYLNSAIHAALPGRRTPSLIPAA